MIAQVFVLLAIIAVSFAQTYPQVFVELYYEALCPGCQQFITTSLTNLMNTPDVEAITKLKLVPYGNTKKNSDGSFTCQHGADECTSDVYEMCTMYKLGNNITHISTGEQSKAAWPFISCMEQNEGNPSYASSCFSKTMGSTGLAWSTVTACASQEANAVQNEGMKATPSDHQYVPWVLVDGKLLDNTNLLIQAVCNAYTGPKPSSCKRLNDTPSKCMNN